MKIGVIGCTHGSIAWTKFAISAFYRRGIDQVVSLGDFGILPGHRRFLDEIESELFSYLMNLWVVPGNHEDYSQIKNYVTRKDGTLKCRSSISVLPRGHRWEWDGVSFVALGGAPSVDRTTRRGGDHGWWEEEAITDLDVAVTAAGGHADVMLAHDAPLVQEIDRELARRDGHGPTTYYLHDRNYAREGRLRMQQAFEAVAPKVFMHSHHHMLVQTTHMGSRVIGLNRDFTNENMAILDVSQDRIFTEVLDIREDWELYTKATGLKTQQR